MVAKNCRDFSIVIAVNSEIFERLPTSGQFALFISPENTRKANFSCVFREYKMEIFS